MKFTLLSPKRSLNKGFLKQRLLRSDMDSFKAGLNYLIENIDPRESEDFHKKLMSDFLGKTLYKDANFINAKGRQDLVIHNGKDNKSTVGVIFEVKKPTNKADWFSAKSINVKALHELVLYYLRERIEANNIDIKYLVATNIHEWYIIDASYFEKLFFHNRALVKDYEEWRDGKKVTPDTGLFYNEIAKPFIDNIKDEIPCTYFDIRDYTSALSKNDKEEDKNLIALFKILSPYHLLKNPFADDSNTLNEEFYRELLHIMGLEEIKEGSKPVIRRKKENRSPGSFIENIIAVLETEDPLHKIPNIADYGENPDEQRYHVALELTITWINRILFLKLLEGQLVGYHSGNRDYLFLNTKTIPGFGEMYKLFHQVLAVNIADRSEAIQKKYSRVPYLNSSLFEISALEDQTIKINSLDSSAPIQFHPATILKDLKKKGEPLKAPDYLFRFLDAFDFASEGKGDLVEENKPLINASVLGKVYEKINGYKDGSIFTPGFITMYMARQSIRLAVVDKFKEKYGWNIDIFDDLKNYIADKRTTADVLEMNKLVNSMHICDPAVGSGHFLVSALNEIIAVKSELGLLADDKGIRLQEIKIVIENDDLTVLYASGHEDDFFEYKTVKDYIPKSIQRIQVTIFKEKQTIIENCLFGVDINPNSVKICRLRLWIELLKNAYYTEISNHTQLETLPNIDINIKCGNSLLSRFSLDSDLTKALRSINYNIEAYKGFVNGYKNEKNREVKRGLEKIIESIKTNFKTTIYPNNPIKNKLDKALNELYNRFSGNMLFEPEVPYGNKDNKAEKEKKKLEAEVERLTTEWEDIKNDNIYRNAFEWRFEFPEVLNNYGEFEGFDVVIANPPYIKEDVNRNAFNGLRTQRGYQGKMDLWYLFGDLGLRLLKPEGYLNYIATNNWVTNSGASKFRNIIVRESKFLQLIDFASFMVFDNASIQTMVMLFQKNHKEDNYSFDYRKFIGEKLVFEDAKLMLSAIKTDNTVFLSPTINKETLIDKPFTFNTDINSTLLDKIKGKKNFYLREKNNTELDARAEVGSGIDVLQDFVSRANVGKLDNNIKVGDGVFVLSNSEYENLQFSTGEKEIIKPYFTTDQLQKYIGRNRNNYWVIYTKSDINKPDRNTNKAPIDNYPNVKQHLDKFQNIMTSAFKPYGLHRTREQHFFEGDKIFALRKCPKEPRFTFTDFPCYVSRAFLIIQTNRINLKYLTGLLNSKLIAFWLRNKGKMQGNNYQIDKEPLLEIPIFKPSEDVQNQVAAIVDDIIAAKKTDLNSDTSPMEHQIDLLVYHLYDLTLEEAQMIDAGITEKEWV